MGGRPGITQALEDYYLILYVIIVPTVFALIILFGTIGNSVVIFVILSKKKLQTVTHMLLINLAVSGKTVLYNLTSYVIDFMLIIIPYKAYHTTAYFYLHYITFIIQFAICVTPGLMYRMTNIKVSFCL